MVGTKTTVLSTPHEVLGNLLPTCLPNPISCTQLTFVQGIKPISTSGVFSSAWTPLPFTVRLHFSFSLWLSMNFSDPFPDSPPLCPISWHPDFSFRALVTVGLHRLGYVFNVSDCELCKGKGPWLCSQCPSYRLAYGVQENLMWYEMQSEVFPVFCERVRRVQS